MKASQLLAHVGELAQQGATLAFHALPGASDAEREEAAEKFVQGGLDMIVNAAHVPALVALQALPWVRGLERGVIHVEVKRALIGLHVEQLEAPHGLATPPSGAQTARAAQAVSHG